MRRKREKGIDEGNMEGIEDKEEEER